MRETLNGLCQAPGSTGVSSRPLDPRYSTGCGDGQWRVLTALRRGGLGCGRSVVGSAPDQQGPDDPGRFVGLRHSGELGRAAFQQRLEPANLAGCFGSGMADYRSGAQHEEPSQGAVSPL
jgi:hypothetical protein